MSTRDPLRMRDPRSGEHPNLRSLLEAGRTELPSSAQMRAMELRLDAALAARVNPASGRAAGTARSLLPIVTLGLALAGLGGAIYRAVHSLEPTAGQHPAVRAAQPAQGFPAAGARAGAQTKGDAAGGEPPPAAEPASAAVESQPASEDAPRAPARRPRARTERSRAPADATQAAPDELTLIDEAQRALAQAPARALARVETHARLYPRGEYVQEREVIAVEALLRLRRHGEAERRAARFLARFDGSSHAPRVRTQLAHARAATQGSR